jgi:translation elongation factor EF-Tu-like GTPase
MAEINGGEFNDYADIDNAPEERERGITISTAGAYIYMGFGSFEFFF